MAAGATAVLVRKSDRWAPPGRWNETRRAGRSQVAPCLRPPTDGAGAAGLVTVIDLDVKDGVAWLRLNRPRLLNALDRSLTGALEDTLPRVAAMDDVTVLVLAGRGRAFCAGTDIVAPPTLEASVAGLAADIARAPRTGLAATKAIVAAIRRGERARGPEAYGAALRTSPEARARIRAFVERKRKADG